jgi:hypothetical protein
MADGDYSLLPWGFPQENRDPILKTQLSIIN